eukprot:TRINITY_DN4278_c0_g1_i1.p1 TRINITY_DN4278_c0_g1~~TRINITY_DN4278_c0_g1_i1.p1  ORF type:complete len:957 (+),score=243.33 TRINITY_DN4278_c0_g1_i1:39-2873(+)
MRSALFLMLSAASAQQSSTGTVQACGGIGAIRCADEFECDTSNCQKGQVDCMGVCVKTSVPPVPSIPSTIQSCGGIGALQCPDEFDCDFSNCQKGQVDCMGTCIKKPLSGCATLRCAFGCEVDPVTGKGMCISAPPPPSCDPKCGDGFECRDDGVGGVGCMPIKESCSTIFCIATTTCKDHPTKGPICVPIDPPTCSVVDCEAGMDCVDDKTFGAECVYNCMTKEVWSPEKSKWCCENMKMGCTVPVPEPEPQPVPVPEPVPGRCVDGETKQVACNTCVCLNGEFSCTEIGCAIERCTTSSCDDDEICIIANGKVECIEQKPIKIDDCDLEMEEAILCGPGGMCKEGYECTGCQDMCKCGPNGEKICSSECRRTCKKVKESNCLKQPVTQWKQLGCESFSCFGSYKTPTMEQMFYCCETTGRFCKDGNDMFDCMDDPKGWTYSQRKWCCEEKMVGCPVAQFDCSIPEEAIEIMKNAEGLLQSSFVDSKMWDQKQSKYCCEKFQVGCDPNVDIFDCEWNSFTVGAWSEEQAEWCCAVKGKRCPRVVEETEEMKGKREKCQAKKEVRAMWDEETRLMCCLIEGVECKSDKYDCYGDNRALSEWSKDQKEWCCDEMYVGCDFDCRAEPELLTSEQKDDCCDSKGLHCPQEVIDEAPSKVDKKFRKALRFLFKGAFSKIKDNPKKFLRKFRKTILKVAKSLKSDGLDINFIGGLMNENVVPPMEMLEKWGTKIPSSWNREMFKGESSDDSSDSSDASGSSSSGSGSGSSWMTGSWAGSWAGSWTGSWDSSDSMPVGDALPTIRGVITLGADSVSELSSVDEGAFVDLEISDNDASVLNMGAAELNTAVEQSKTGTGPFRDNSDGSTLIMEPVGEGMAAGETSSTSSDSDSNTGLIVALSLISALCVGGMVIAGVIMHKRKQDTQPKSGSDELLTFEKCQAMEQDTCRV